MKADAPKYDRREGQCINNSLKNSKITSKKQIRMQKEKITYTAYTSMCRIFFSVNDYRLPIGVL